MKKIILAAIGIVGLLCTTSCATVGNKFDSSLIDSFVVGKTTETEVVALIGKPLTVTSATILGSKKKILSYSYAHSQVGKSTVGNHAAFVFNDQGVLETVTHSETGKDPS